MNSVSESIKNQWSAVIALPQTIIANSPISFGFALVNYGLQMVLSVIPAPNIGGQLGKLAFGSLVNGFGDVVKFTAWDALKGANMM